MSDHQINDKPPSSNASVASTTKLVNRKNWEAKINSKREAYDFLTIQGGAYLPEVDCVNIYFLKDLIARRKQCKRFILSSSNFLFLSGYKAKDVKVMRMPQYEHLTVK